ncbi:hypothetical protein TNCV_3287491 [Trichonephila clavipes]|nr:hypothetical protein TNCV_3287491 [Trichonephila clavipes]
MQSVTITTPDSILKKKSQGCVCYFPKRVIFAVFGFFGIFNVYALRANLSVAMVAMVNTSETATKTNISYADECPYLTDEDEEARNSRYSKVNNNNLRL